MAHIEQPRPDAGLVFQVKVLHSKVSKSLPNSECVSCFIAGVQPSNSRATRAFPARCVRCDGFGNMCVAELLIICKF